MKRGALLRNGAVLAAELETAETAGERCRGLLGRAALAPGRALWIEPCAAIHTGFMRFPIDLAFVDAAGRVLQVRRGLAPWRMAACPRARAAVEFGAGWIPADGLAAGDILQAAPPGGGA